MKTDKPRKCKCCPLKHTSIRVVEDKGVWLTIFLIIHFTHSEFSPRLPSLKWLIQLFPLFTNYFPDATHLGKQYKKVNILTFTGNHLFYLLCQWAI